MRMSSKFVSLLFTTAAFAQLAQAGDGIIDRNFGEVPGYTAFGVSGQNYIAVSAAAATRFDRTFYFIEGMPDSNTLHLARMYTSSGLLDPAFGPNQDGLRSTNMPAGLGGPAPHGALAMQDGTPIVYGRLRAPIDGDHAGFVCRFAVAGNLLSGFGTNGCTTVRSMIAGDEWLEVTAATEDNFGRIVIAGYYYAQDQNGPTIEHRFVARLTSTGAFDTEFNGGIGFKTLPPYAGDGHWQVPTEVRVDSQGRILLLSMISIDAQSNSSDTIVQRYDDGGSIDPAFGQDGTRRISFDEGFAKYDAAAGMALLPDGRIIVLVHRASSSDSIALMRFNADATAYDPAFNGGAPRIESLPENNLTPTFGPLLVDDLGRSLFIIDGGTFQQRRPMILRHRHDGTPDPAFGANGRSEFTGQQLTGVVGENLLNTVAFSIVGRDQLVVTGTLSDANISNKRAASFAVTAAHLFRDSYD